MVARIGVSDTEAHRYDIKKPGLLRRSFPGEIVANMEQQFILAEFYFFRVQQRRVGAAIRVGVN